MPDPASLVGLADRAPDVFHLRDGSEAAADFYPVLHEAAELIFAYGVDTAQTPLHVCVGCRVERVQAKFVCQRVSDPAMVGKHCIEFVELACAQSALARNAGMFEFFDQHQDSRRYRKGLHADAVSR